MRDPKYTPQMTDRELNLLIQEMRDGCCDCPDEGELCPTHCRQAAQLQFDNCPDPVPQDQLPELTAEEREAFGL